MAAPIRALIGGKPVTEPEQPDEPISCNPSDKCPHGVFRREYCSLCPEFVGYSEPLKRTRAVTGNTVLGRESADVFECSCRGAVCHKCKPYTPAYRRRCTLSHARRMWVEIKTDHNGHPVQPRTRMREIYTLEAHQFRLAEKFRFNHPIQKEHIADHPFRGWLTGLGVVRRKKWEPDLYKLPKHSRQQAIRFMRWVVGRQYRRAAKRYVRWTQGMQRKMLIAPPTGAPAVEVIILPNGERKTRRKEYRQYHPSRKTRQENINFYRQSAPRMKAFWRLQEKASWHTWPLSALPEMASAGNPDTDGLPYEPFELAYPYCPRNPASRWPPIWVRPSVMPRHTVFNSAVGLEFTDRTLADSRRSYLISQPLLADLWGCSQRTVWARLQEIGGCACRVCLAAKMPEFGRLLYRAILPTIRPKWGSEVGSQEAKRKQRKADKKRALVFEFGSFAEGWGWDKKSEE